MVAPRVTVIKVTPMEDYYWATKHATGAVCVEMLIGAVLRKTVDDPIQDGLNV